MENTTLVEDVNSVALPIEDLDDAVRLVDLFIKFLFSRVPIALIVFIDGDPPSGTLRVGRFYAVQ